MNMSVSYILMKQIKLQLNFNIHPFSEIGDGSTSTRWELWKDQFVSYLILKGIDDHDDMFKALMCFGGSDVRKIARDVTVSESAILDNRYRLAMEVLDNYYSPKMSQRYERFRFRQLMFNPNEKIDQFMIRLKEQAAQCGFGDQVDDMIMDQIVFATQHEDKLRAKYLEADTTLEEMLKIARTHESVKSQIQELRGKSVPLADLNAVGEVVSDSKQGRIACSRCMGNHLANDARCPAKASRCSKCGKLGHYARCCKTPHFRAGENRSTQKLVPNRRMHYHHDGQQKFVREVDDVTNTVEIRELFHLEGKRTADATIGGVNVRFIIDTGADEDVLSVDDWKTLKRVGFNAFDVRKGSDKVFRAYGSMKSLTVLGEVDARVAVGGKYFDTTLFVIQDGKCSLLSGKTAEALGIIKFLHAVTDEVLPCIKGKKS